ncbi:MAG TPA: PKD domain-containing protein, partial [Ferruginibacter sp.]|nr:PKD domain-containing protein [Ferruginibacter sp.]
SVTSGCYPLHVQFSDASIAAADSIAQWNWDFGDGFSSSEKNPAHTYTSGGNFNVTLQVTNSNGCVSTLTKSSLIQISSGSSAAFSIGNAKGCGIPASIDFQNNSTGTGALSYIWSFGDGGTSTLANPTHTYTEKGTYDVQLIVKTSNGCTDTLMKKNGITVGTVQANFTAKDSACVSTSIAFTNTSAPNPGSVLWSFGDNTTSVSLNPTKTYSTPGIYTVKLVASFGACTDSVTKNIHVLPRPVVAFTASDTSSCKTPFTVTYTNQSTDGAIYRWTLPGASNSNLENPTVTYNSAGSFTAALQVTSIFGCINSITKAKYINIESPKVLMPGLPDSGCISFTKTFRDSVVSSDPVSSYLWNFGDGTTSTDKNPTHTYTAAGNYTVKLVITTVSGCTDSAVRNNAIIATGKPQVSFSANLTNTCAKNEIQFTDQTTGGATKWFWDFGDKTTSAIRNPKKIYADTGHFDVKLIVWNRGCKDSVTYQKYIYIAPPIAKFRTRYSCTKPFERIFTDLSIGANEWHWDFGDGNTSTVRSPTHTYAAAGTYSVSLRVVNHSTGCDFTATQLVTVLNTQAVFEAEDTIICRGNTVKFNTGLSRSEIRSFNWNFGDGSSNQTLSSVSANYTYKENGMYTVRLLVTDLLGCTSELVKPNYISVGGPSAAFGIATPGSCRNTTVLFTDSSATDENHPIVSWQWNYGDGNSATLGAAPFQHSYSNSGLYTISLKVTDSNGCSDSTTLSTPFEITEPKADFSVTDTVSCPGKPIHFTNQSSGKSLQYLWHFGDGGTATGENPEHSYSANGDYTVKLIITDTYGCKDSVIKTQYIHIVSPTAQFSISDSFTTCPPLLVQFTNNSTGAITTSWDFGDDSYSTAINPSHFYTYPGNFTARLTVTGVGGCTAIMEKTIVIQGPTGYFEYEPVNGCKPLTVNFEAHSNHIVTYIWDFNDGTIITTADSIVSHTYTNPGSYVPKIILVNNNGCQVPIKGKDTIFVNNVITGFSFDNKALCDSGFVTFNNTSVSNTTIAGYAWNFGDGGTSTAVNPTHRYNSTGTYFPSLITTTVQGCTDTLLSTSPVKVVASPAIDMTVSANGCVPLTVTYTGIVTTPDTSALNWNWTFGNGNNSAFQNPKTQLYTTAGTYPANLTVTNSSGCTTTLTQNTEAYPIPHVDAGNTVILCEGSSITLNATGADTYAWTPATGLNCSNCASPTTSVDYDIVYHVTGTTINGCSATDSVQVLVKHPISINYSNPVEMCKGQSTQLSATGANSYEWTPSAGLSNAAIATPTAKPDVTTNYRVVGTDEFGCFKDTGFVLITVNPVPTVDAGKDKTINVGETVDLVPTISSDVTEVIWTPTFDGFRNIYPGITVRPTENTEFTVEVATNRGCRARDKITVFVICNDGNVFIPNTFSPNGDGANDIFYPRGKGLFRVKSLKIFNRWGEMVFAKNDFNANDPSSGWDGTFKGKKLNEDVFVYVVDIICSNKSILTFKGNVALIQ